MTLAISIEYKAKFTNSKSGVANASQGTHQHQQASAHHHARPPAPGLAHGLSPPYLVAP